MLPSFSVVVRARVVGTAGALCLAAGVLAAAALPAPPAAEITASFASSASPAPAGGVAPWRSLRALEGPLPRAAVAPPPPVEQQVSAPPAAPLLRSPARAAAPPRRGVGSPEQRGGAALDALTYPWQELGWSVRFAAYTGGLLGLADPRTRTITVFVDDRHTDQQLRTTLAHELGHAVDLVTGTPEQRERYRALRGIDPDIPWFACAGCSDFGSPAGDWAEVFALWLVGPGDFRSTLRPPPDAAQLAQIAPLFAPPSARAAPAPAPTASPEPTPTRRPLLPLRLGGGASSRTTGS